MSNKKYPTSLDYSKFQDAIRNEPKEHLCFFDPVTDAPVDKVTIGGKGQVTAAVSYKGMKSVHNHPDQPITTFSTQDLKAAILRLEVEQCVVSSDSTAISNIGQWAYGQLQVERKTSKLIDKWLSGGKDSHAAQWLWKYRVLPVFRKYNRSRRFVRMRRDTEFQVSGSQKRGYLEVQHEAITELARELGFYYERIIHSKEPDLTWTDNLPEGYHQLNLEQLKVICASLHIVPIGDCKYGETWLAALGVPGYRPILKRQQKSNLLKVS